MANDIRTALEHQINTKLYAEILQDAHELSNISACAGLFDVPYELYYKGAVNYYGSQSEHIPARRWLDAGTGVNQRISQGRYEYLRVFRDIIEKHLSDPRQQAAVGKKVEGRILNLTPALSGTYRSGPKHIMRDIAEALASNMRDYITAGRWISNAPSTIAAKGFDWPLIWTGELLYNIKAVVEEGVEDVKDGSGRGGRNDINKI